MWKERKTEWSVQYKKITRLKKTKISLKNISRKRANNKRIKI